MADDGDRRGHGGHPALNAKLHGQPGVAELPAVRRWPDAGTEELAEGPDLVLAGCGRFGPLWSTDSMRMHSMRPNSRNFDQMQSNRPGLTTLNRVFPEDSVVSTPPCHPPFSHQHRVRSGNPVVFDVLMGIR